METVFEQKIRVDRQVQMCIRDSPDTPPYSASKRLIVSLRHQWYLGLFVSSHMDNLLVFCKTKAALVWKVLTHRQDIWIDYNSSRYRYWVFFLNFIPSFDDQAVPYFPFFFPNVFNFLQRGHTQWSWWEPMSETSRQVDKQDMNRIMMVCTFLLPITLRKLNWYVWLR